MNKCAQFCRLALITLNGITLVKSVDMILVGAVMNVLQTAYQDGLNNITFDSRWLASASMTGSDVYENAWLFFLTSGPIFFVVSCLGLYGAAHRSRIALGFFIILEAIVIMVTVTFSFTKVKGAITTPTERWRPFSEFVLSGIILTCAFQGFLIFFSIIVISALRENQVSPNSNNQDFTPRKPPPANSYRRNSNFH